MPSNPLLLLLLLQFATISPLITSLDLNITIGIGGGGGGGGGEGGGGESPSPSPSPCSGSSPPSPPQPSDFPNLKQYEAYLVIQKFKQSLTCDPKNVSASWTGYRPCTYTGFYCAAPPSSPDTPTIYSVDFNGFGLGAPTVAGFVDRLPDLSLFHANSNSFAGTLPDLTALPYLYELDVSNNLLSGPFPSNVLPLSQVTFLDLRYNRFAGCVPPELFRKDLDVLFLNNNRFRDEIPYDLGASNAAYLTLANNGFTGAIPKSICNASETLLEVLFLNNELSGCLPYEIGLLRLATVFDVGNNQVTGPIPWSFGCLKRVDQLNLAGNLLYGHVPDVLCRLGKCGELTNLSLSGNYFTSIGKSCWQLLKNGVLDIRRNCIPGLPEQRPHDECACFSAKPKLCPLSTHMPCIVPTGRKRAAERSPPLMAVHGRRTAENGHLRRSFATYAALQDGKS